MKPEMTPPETTPEQRAAVNNAIERLYTRGDATIRFACLRLRRAILQELCERLITGTTRDAWQWVRTVVSEPPGSGSVDRFSSRFFEEYRVVRGIK